MNYVVTRQSSLFCLFETLGIPKRVAGALLVELRKWLKCNGPEWTVARIKEFHILAVKWVGGDSEYRIPSSAGISTHRDGVPRGPFSWVIRSLMERDLSPRKLDRVMAVLKLYSAITLTCKVPSHTQWKKFLTAVEQPEPVKNYTGLGMDPRYANAFRPLWYEAKYDHIKLWTQSQEKSVISWDPDKPPYLATVKESHIPLAHHVWNAAAMSYPIISRFLKIYNKSMREHRYPQNIEKYLDLVDWKVWPIRPIYPDDGVYPPEDWAWLKPELDRKRERAECSARFPIVGSIGVIQERGAKARFIANPLRVHQLAISRLQNWLSLIVKRGLPWDCTYDQGKGVRWSQRKLIAGHTLWSVDLSNATDQFPLEVVLDCLRTMGPNGSDEFTETLLLFETICRSPWYIPSTKSTITWTKGIPLGIYASFLSFAVTHGFLLRKLELDNGIEDAFVVLGDDVVMTDTIGAQYVALMSDLGVPINPQKGLVSSLLSEFAAKLVMKGRLIRSFKFPSGVRLFSTQKPLELLEKYGRKSIRLVPSQFRDVVISMASLPRSRGGLGWKPPKDLGFLDIKKDFNIAPSERIPDVMRYEVHNGQSIRMLRVSRADRESELKVAFRRDLLEKHSMKHADLTSLKGDGIYLYFDDGTPWYDLITSSLDEDNTNDISQPIQDQLTVELQWDILHANASRDEPALQGYRDELRNEVMSKPRLDRSYIFGKPTTRLGAFRRKLTKYYKNVIIGFVFYLRPLLDMEIKREDGKLKETPKKSE